MRPLSQRLRHLFSGSSHTPRAICFCRSCSAIWRILYAQSRIMPYSTAQLSSLAARSPWSARITILRARSSAFLILRLHFSAACVFIPPPVPRNESIRNSHCIGSFAILMPIAQKPAKSPLNLRQAKVFRQVSCLERSCGGDVSNVGHQRRSLSRTGLALPSFCCIINCRT